MFAVLAPAPAAQAHALDAYLQASYLTVTPAQIVVELDLTPGVLAAPAILPLLDTDGDASISEAEGRAYVESVLASVSLQVDGEVASLEITKIELPTYLTIQAGYGMIRVFTQAALPESQIETHQISYINGYAPTGSVYQVNTFVESAGAVTLGTQNRDDLRQSLRVDYSVGIAGASADSLATSQIDTSAASIGQAHRLLAYFDTPVLSPWKLMLALSLAVVIGGLHALTPGHGKTLVAAYLVGSRGTVRHAATLGAIVTFTHTASVVVIGLIALFASHYIVPGVLVPILQVVSGLLVVFMGGKLIWQRWIAFRHRNEPVHPHLHDHDHDHVHDHSHSHDHGDGHTHSHLPPIGGLNFNGLLAMGVSGGLVPCPEALGIMIIAVGLNRILLGLGLIVSFSVGLAAVLIAIGILLVRSRSLVERVGGMSGRLSRGLPLGSAVLVTALGVGITLGGISAYIR